MKKSNLKYYKICRVKCLRCGDVLEYENVSKTDMGPGSLMTCSCRKVALDPSVVLYRILGSQEDWEDQSVEWT